MNARSSPNNPRFSSGTPTRNQQYGARQPLYLQPNSPYMSPRMNRMGSPRNSYGSPDFIPLGVSSPVGRAKKNWSGRNYSNNSSYSSMSSPPSSNSSLNFSPYRRHGSRGNFRGRGSFNSSNNSGSNSPHISLYIDKEALEDPWAELEGKLKHLQMPANTAQSESEGTQSTVLLDSDSESSSEDGVS